MADFGSHNAQPILPQLLACGPGPTSEPRPRRRNRQNSSSAGNKAVVHHVSMKPSSTLSQLASWMLKNQISLATSLVAFLFLAHMIPGAQPHTTKFFTLSYRNPATGKYANGFDDVYLIACFIILFTGLRASVMKYILAPFGRTWGIHKAKDVTRFCEQSWLLCYYSVFWTMGMYIFYNSPYWLNMRNCWINWPDRELTGLVKFYIIAQWSFWMQQIIIVNIEERRKDYTQTVLHHFVTVGLIYTAYAYHVVPIGNQILVITDFIDLILPLAKCLKYMGFKKICDYVFAIFVVAWALTRHLFFGMAVWSVYSHSREVIGESCWRGTAQNLEGPLSTPKGYAYLMEPYLDPQGIVCWNSTIRWLMVGPLLVLKVMNCVWLYMIIRILVKVVRKQGVEDSRSDDEEDSKNE